MRGFAMGNSLFLTKIDRFRRGFCIDTGRRMRYNGITEVSGMEKTVLRSMLREKKRTLTEAQIESASARLAQMLFAHPMYRQANALYAYLSYNQEVRTEAILRQALADGKRVAVPKVFGEEIRFLRFDENTSIALGYKGIPEPTEGEPADEPDALVLMPGLAFDPMGHRMGYGGGFYDRFLAKEPHPTIALCYDFQLLSDLPVQAHDIPVDAVLSAPILEENA